MQSCGLPWRNFDPLPLAMRLAHGIEQRLHTITFGKARRHRPAPFDCVEKAAGHARHRGNAAFTGKLPIERIVFNRDGREHCGRAAAVAHGEAAHIVRRRIGQHQRALLAVQIPDDDRCRDRTRNSWRNYRTRRRLEGKVEHDVGLERRIVGQSGKPRG